MIAYVDVEEFWLFIANIADHALFENWMKFADTLLSQGEGGGVEYLTIKQNYENQKNFQEFLRALFRLWVRTNKEGATVEAVCSVAQSCGLETLMDLIKAQFPKPKGQHGSRICEAPSASSLGHGGRLRHNVLLPVTNFVDKGVLGEIHTFFGARDKASTLKIWVLSGDPCNGKTQTARQYASLFLRNYKSGCISISAKDAFDVTGSLMWTVNHLWLLVIDEVDEVDKHGKILELMQTLNSCPPDQAAPLVLVLGSTAASLHEKLGKVNTVITKSWVTELPTKGELRESRKPPLELRQFEDARLERYRILKEPTEPMQKTFDMAVNCELEKEFLTKLGRLFVAYERTFVSNKLLEMLTQTSAKVGVVLKKGKDWEQNVAQISIRLFALVRHFIAPGAVIRKHLFSHFIETYLKRAMGDADVWEDPQDIGDQLILTLTGSRILENEVEKIVGGRRTRRKDPRCFLMESSISEALARVLNSELIAKLVKLPSESKMQEDIYEALMVEYQLPAFQKKMSAHINYFVKGVVCSEETTCFPSVKKGLHKLIGTCDETVLRLCVKRYTSDSTVEHEDRKHFEKALRKIDGPGKVKVVMNSARTTCLIPTR